jgi:hypothetical protein
MGEVNKTSVLIPNINEAIFDHTHDGKRIKRELFPSADSINLNIEYIVSLLESSHVSIYQDYANKLRTHFQAYLVNKLKYVEPKLAKTLLKMHNTPRMKEIEELTGIITLNYDSLIDDASQEVLGYVNYSIRCKANERSKYIISNEKNKMEILKVHGSFNWGTGKMIEVFKSRLLKENNESLWMPPSIYKHTDRYPFNHLWGRAHELLNCDVLRIIGCSLNQNDWGLLELLFKTQLLSESTYRIELIGNPNIIDEVRKRYAFLKNVVGLNEIDWTEYAKNKEDISKNLELGPIPVGDNYFKIWLSRRLRIFDFMGYFSDSEKSEINKIIGEVLL